MRSPTTSPVWIVATTVGLLRLPFALPAHLIDDPPTHRMCPDGDGQISRGKIVVEMWHRFVVHAFPEFVHVPDAIIVFTTRVLGTNNWLPCHDRPFHLRFFLSIHQESPSGLARGGTKTLGQRLGKWMDTQKVAQPHIFPTLAVKLPGSDIAIVYMSQLFGTAEIVGVITEANECAGAFNEPHDQVEA